MAVRLGKANVDALARSLTAKQFLEWEAYEQIEHALDVKRIDYIGASICAVIANVNRAKGQKAYTVEDFVLKFAGEEPRQSPEEQFAIMKLLAAAHASDDGTERLTKEQAAEDAALAADMRTQIMKARAAMIVADKKEP